VVAFDPIGDAGSKTMKPPLIQPSPMTGFSSKETTRSASMVMPPKREGGRTAVRVARRPLSSWKLSRAFRSMFETPSP
jgi:hypothetical protein